MSDIPSDIRARLPATIRNPGLLVGWSLEREHARQPIGFSFGNPMQTPQQGYLDPILFNDEGHLITIAPTGAGKGVGCIVPALLRHQGPVIVIDPKGENYAITARRRREIGQKVFVLDPMGTTNAPPEERANFNPLDAIDVEDATAVDEMSAAIATFAARLKADRDQFWVGRATQLLIGVLAHVLADLPPAERNLRRVRDLLLLSVSEPEVLVERLKRSRHPVANQTPGLLGIKAPETLAGIQSFAQDMLGFVRGPMVEQAVSSTSFNLDDITTGAPMTIYIVLPPHMLSSHGQLLRLWISALLAAIMRRRSRPATPTLFILDEAAQLGHLTQLQQSITLLRGYGLKTWSFWQDVSQIKLHYPYDWETMINNCRVVQCFGANNMSAARTMSELVGFGTAGGILDLKDDEMLLQVAGDEGVYARLPNYRTDPAFAVLYDENPFYGQIQQPMTRAPMPVRWYMRPRKPWVDPWLAPPALPSGQNDPQATELLDRIRKRRAGSRR
ncbi:MAG: type IV secretory system conjugative DNA transfer family protein [Cypionkella sp.]